MKQINLNFERPILKLRDYFLSGEDFQLLKDSDTQILKTLPVPKNLDSYYESDEYLSHSKKTDSFFARCYAFAKALNLKSKSKLIAQYAGRKPVLDIGAGVGDLVKELKIAGLDAEGFEPNSKARKIALDQGVHLKSSLENEEQDLYGLISMYHVLEHVPDIIAQKRQIENLLLPEGILILALPNYDSWDAKFFKKYWAAYDVPRHLFHFNRQAVRNFFNDKFELLEEKPLWFDSLYVSILSARYKKMPLPFSTGIILGLWSNLRALFNQEYSSIAYILKKRDFKA